MTKLRIDSRKQSTQGLVLDAMQHNVSGSNTAATIGRVARLSPQQAAAALKLLEDKGAVERRAPNRWRLTDAGATAEIV